MLAAIDVGSNTVRLLLGDVVQGKVQPIAYERRITRLKGGQTEDGLAQDAMDRTLSALDSFSKTILKHNPDAITVVGTEALRSAPNRELFVDLVLQKTGLDLKIISGAEEATLSARGVLSVVAPTPDHAIILDIGGGSTEIILTNGLDVLFRHSCPLGVVRLAEMEFGSSVDEFIGTILKDLSRELSTRQLMETACCPQTSVIGTAGTVTTLAALDLEMTTYDWRRVNNHKLQAAIIDKYIHKLTPMSVQEREGLPGMEEGRGDLILPGLMVLKKLLQTFVKPELIVSDFGLLEGLILHSADNVAIH